MALEQPRYGSPKTFSPPQPAPVQEPVAVVSGYYGGQCVVLPTNPARLFNSGTAFYTAPQPVPVKTYHDGKPWPVAPKPWVNLTDGEIDLFINGRGDEDDDNYVEPTGDGFGLTDADLVTLVRRAETKLREKNGGAV
jgi:hypothetical protein